MVRHIVFSAAIGECSAHFTLRYFAPGTAACSALYSLSHQCWMAVPPSPFRGQEEEGECRRDICRQELSDVRRMPAATHKFHVPSHYRCSGSFRTDTSATRHKRAERCMENLVPRFRHHTINLLNTVRLLIAERRIYAV